MNSPFGEPKQCVASAILVPLNRTFGSGEVISVLGDEEREREEEKNCV